MTYYPDPDKYYKTLLELFLDEEVIYDQADENSYEYAGDER